MLELYDSIRQDELPVEKEVDTNFTDLIKRILEKDPAKRIKMDEIRVSTSPGFSTLVCLTMSESSLGHARRHRSATTCGRKLRRSHRATYGS